MGDTEKQPSIQQAFLRKIESVISKNSSLAGELADILNISSDSAYRRIRGETILTIEEAITLCNHFKISFDSIQNIEDGIVTFKYNVLNEDIDSFVNYMESLKKDLQIINTAKNSKIIYACEDIPIFHNFNYPAVSAFKVFYWLKSIMNVASLQGAKFDVSKISDEVKTLGKEIYDLYASVPSVEIWTETTILGTLKQIEFYRDSGMFESKKDVIEVCEALKEELNGIQQQAEAGHKFNSEGPNINKNNAYNIYHCQLEITNNCVLVDMGEVQRVYLGHLSFNTMSTSNASYCKETEIWLSNIIKKSALISGVAEIHRYQYFKKALSALDNLILKIEKE